MPTTLRKPIDYTFEVDLLIQAQLDALVAQANRFGGELELAIALLLALEKPIALCSSCAQAVNIITGIWLVVRLSFNCLHNSKPSIASIITSLIISSGTFYFAI